MHVQPEDRNLLGHPAQLVDDTLVARLVRDLLVLPARERMRPRRSDQRPSRRGSVAKECADLPHLRHRLTDRRVDSRRRFEHGGHQLAANAPVSGGVRDLLEPRHELVALGREELEFFLDPHGERRGTTEGMLHGCSLARGAADMW